MCQSFQTFFFVSDEEVIYAPLPVISFIALTKCVRDFKCSSLSLMIRSSKPHHQRLGKKIKNIDHTCQNLSNILLCLWQSGHLSHQQRGRKFYNFVNMCQSYQTIFIVTDKEVIYAPQPLRRKIFKTFTKCVRTNKHSSLSVTRRSSMPHCQ